MRGIANFRGSRARILSRVLKWHLMRLIGANTFPLIATFQLTNRCNLRCVMCNIPNNPDAGTMPLELFTSIVRDLGSMGCCYASLSGGEVLTINGFFGYLRAAKENIPSVNMVTNGVLLDDGAAKEIASSQVDSVALSLDGMEKGHEHTRGMPGSFKKTVEAIGFLKRRAPKVKVVVNTVIAPWNLRELYALTRFVEGLGVMQKFQPLNVHPMFEGQKSEYRTAEAASFDESELRDFIAFLLTCKNVANSRYFLSSIPGYITRRGTARLLNEDCTLPSFLCEFRENGLMYPCLGGTNWRGGYRASEGVRKVFESPEYRGEAMRLKSCRGCAKSLSVCYIEPRASFPAANLLKYRLMFRASR